mmetsp:Transcript_15848/g.23169  ORF Transcript_15848/g.23169 Transcript_15848/m.23169 type:complete len:255 (-) Transcript_15848:54-818(-)
MSYTRVILSPRRQQIIKKQELEAPTIQVESPAAKISAGARKMHQTTFSNVDQDLPDSSDLNTEDSRHSHPTARLVKSPQATKPYEITQHPFFSFFFSSAAGTGAPLASTLGFSFGGSGLGASTFAGSSTGASPAGASSAGASSTGASTAGASTAGASTAGGSISSGASTAGASTSGGAATSSTGAGGGGGGAGVSTATGGGGGGGAPPTAGGGGGGGGGAPPAAGGGGGGGGAGGALISYTLFSQSSFLYCSQT